MIDGVSDGVAVAVAVAVSVAVGLFVGVGESVAVAVGEGRAVSVGLTVAVKVGLSVAVGDGVSVAGLSALQAPKRRIKTIALGLRRAIDKLKIETKDRIRACFIGKRIMALRAVLRAPRSTAH